MANTAALLLPTPTFSAVGKIGTGAISGTVTLALPKPILASVAHPQPQVTLTLPTPTLSVHGLVAVVGAVSLTLPPPTLSAKGHASIVGTVNLVLPTPSLVAHTGNRAQLVLPVPQLVGVARTGVTGAVQLVVPAPTLAARGAQPGTAGVTAALPTPRLTVVGRVGNAGAVSNTLRGLALAIEGATGVVGRCTMTLPAPYLNIGGGPVAAGAVTLVLPMLTLQATGIAGAAAIPDTSALPALVMNTQTGALSQYVNYPFNSMAVFNGAYLGASAEGLFVLAQGNLDNTATINAIARLNMTDFGTSFLKRIDRCYVGYRADGDMVVRVYTDEVTTHDYLMQAYGKSGLHGNHTRIGKGLAARFWQFELQNRNGANFQLNTFELKATQLRRRIGGGDA